jgi:hypothetical protein
MIVADLCQELNKRNSCQLRPYKRFPQGDLRLCIKKTVLRGGDEYHKPGDCRRGARRRGAVAMVSGAVTDQTFLVLFVRYTLIDIAYFH